MRRPVKPGELEDILQRQDWAALEELVHTEFVKDVKAFFDEQAREAEVLFLYGTGHQDAMGGVMPTRSKP